MTEKKFIAKAFRMGYKPESMTYEEACLVEQALVIEEACTQSLIDDANMEIGG